MRPLHFETHLRVRYAETDQMGVVHHSSLVNWLEVARIEQCDALGIPYKELEEADLFIPVLELQIRYLKPLYFDDRLKIILKMDKDPKLQFEIHYEIFCKEIKVAEASSKHTFINKKGQVLRPPKLFWEAVASYT